MVTLSSQNERTATAGTADAKVVMADKAFINGAVESWGDRPGKGGRCGGGVRISVAKSGGRRRLERRLEGTGIVSRKRRRGRRGRSFGLVVGFRQGRSASNLVRGEMALALAAVEGSWRLNTASGRLGRHSA